MRTQSILLVLAIFLMRPLASGQAEQINPPNDQHVPHMSVEDMNGFPGIPHPFRAGRFTRDELRRSALPNQKAMSPQSQIYVIDTAIVRSTQDTTRHLYAFNANAKRTTDVTQKLASGGWVNVYRRTDAYDANNRLLSELAESWENGQWVSSERHTCTYDANNRLISESRESWMNGQWVLEGWRKTYAYDANGHLISVLSEQWWNNQLVGSGSITYTYDANGNKLTESYGYPGGNNNARSTYSYDAEGNLLSHLSEVWSNSQWEFSSRYTYAYDANGNMLSWLNEYWTSGQWVNSQCWTYTYDANGNMLSQLYESWSNGQWTNVERVTCTYDAKGDMLSLLAESWSTSDWVNTRRNTQTYDTNGNMLSWLYQTWSNGQWSNLWYDTCSYDANNNLTSLWHYGWFGSWTPVDVARKGGGFTDSAGNYHNYSGYNFTFTYRLIVTDVASQNGSVPAVYSLSQNYPNPFNPSTTIKYELPKSTMVRLSVYDMLGREVSVLVNERSDAGVHEVKFDASRLSSGVYFYRLQAGDFTQTKRLLLLK